MRRLIFLFTFPFCSFINSASSTVPADDNPLRRSFPSPRINTKALIIAPKDGEVSYASYLYNSDMKHSIKSGFLRVKTIRKIHVLIQGFSPYRREELMRALSDYKGGLDGKSSFFKMNTLHSYVMSLLTLAELQEGACDPCKFNVSFLEMKVERVHRQDKAAGSPKLQGELLLERDHAAHDKVTYAKKNCKFIDINGIAKLMVVGKASQRETRKILDNECVRELIVRGAYTDLVRLLAVKQPNMYAALFINEQ